MENKSNKCFVCHGDDKILKPTKCKCQDIFIHSGCYEKLKTNICEICRDYIKINDITKISSMEAFLKICNQSRYPNSAIREMLGVFPLILDDYETLYYIVSQIKISSNRSEIIKKITNLEYIIKLTNDFPDIIGYINCPIINTPEFFDFLENSYKKKITKNIIVHLNTPSNKILIKYIKKNKLNNLEDLFFKEKYDINDIAIMTALCENNGIFLQLANDENKNNIELCKIAIASNFNAIKYISITILKQLDQTDEIRAIMMREIFNGRDARSRTPRQGSN